MTITTLSSTSTAAFTASGLATGMDTNSIIDQLVALESSPITLIQSQQSAIKTQVSALGTLISKLSSLSTAADDLGKNGVFASKVSSTHTAFSIEPGTSAVQGRYSVEVETLARAAKWRSDGLASTATLAAGTLQLTVQGKTYPPTDQAPIAIAQGASLGDVAFAIRQSGAPVSASVLTDGNGLSYLSLTDRDTGVPLDGGAALAVSYSRTGATGTSLDFGTPTVMAGQNAAVWVDGLRFVRSSNVVTDALPGATLTLQKEAPGAAEEVVLTTATDATQARLQTFVDAYNGVMSLVQKQLATNKDADRSTSLTGVSSVRSLQGQLQSLVVSKVAGLSNNVRSLADLGITTSKDSGTLSIDSTRFQKALATDPAAVNSLFSTAGSGLTTLVDGLVERNTRTSDGALVLSQDSLNGSVKDMDDRIASMQRRVDAFRLNLVSQFAAMESTVSSLKSMGTFLTSWSNSYSSSSSK